MHFTRNPWNIWSTCKSSFGCEEAMRNPLRNESGVENIIIMAVALPLLLLLIVAAVDIIRVPTAKAQVYRALNSAFDYLVLDLGNDSRLARKLNGRNWCAILPRNFPAAQDCNSTCEFTAPLSCVNTNFNPGGSWDSSTSLDLARNVIIDELQGTGIFGFGTLDINNLPADASTSDIAVKVGLYNLVAKGMSVDGATSMEIVNALPIGSSLWDGIDGYALNKNILSVVLAKFVTSPSAQTVGLEYGPNAGTHVPVIALWAAVKVTHSFKWPSAIQLGDTPRTGGSHQTESIVTGLVIRPLSRWAWPSNSITSTVVTTTTTTAATTTTTASGVRAGAVVTGSPSAT